MNISQLTSDPKLNQYGCLTVDFQSAILTAYPEIKFSAHEPGCYGGSSDMWLRESNGQWTLNIPSGRYSSSKHFHSSESAIVRVESTRKKHNFAKCPLFLLLGRAYNGDYRSLAKSYYLFGKNEDNSYFLHKIRPSVAEGGDFDRIRKWIWDLKDGEFLAARQGDLGFIPKKRMSGKKSGSNEVALGNHVIRADRVTYTKHRVYALNPIANHGEHVTVQLRGIFELRLGRAWRESSAD